MLTWIVLNVPLVLLPGPTPPVCQLDVLQPAVLEERVLRTFEREVGHYVRLHRRLERTLPPEHLFDDPEDMSLATDALHAALVDARPNAQAGALFTPAVADVLIRRLERAFTVMGLTADQAVLAMRHGYRALPELRVNDRVEAVRHRRMWPALVAALPPLPDELQYRLVGRDLVVIDLHADLVVDILKDALPAPPLDIESYSALPRETPHQVRREDA
jgi:hypothetical protein